VFTGDSRFRWTTHFGQVEIGHQNWASNRGTYLRSLSTHHCSHKTPRPEIDTSPKL